MKKQYIIPLTETINVETQNHMLFASDEGDGKYNGGGEKGTFSSGMTQASRESDWDE